MTTGEYGNGGQESDLAGAIAAVLSDIGAYQTSTLGAGTVYEYGGSRFADLVELRKWADLSFVLGEPVDNPRVRRLQLALPGGWSHNVRLYAVEDVDREVAGWLRAAHDHATIGEMRTDIAPLNRGQLRDFSAVFVSPVVEINRELAVMVPKALQSAIGTGSSVTVQVSGIEYATDLIFTDEDAYIPVDDVTGLGEGRSTEVVLKVRL